MHCSCASRVWTTRPCPPIAFVKQMGSGVPLSASGWSSPCRKQQSLTKTMRGMTGTGSGRCIRHGASPETVRPGTNARLAGMTPGQIC